MCNIEKAVFKERDLIDLKKHKVEAGLIALIVIFGSYTAWNDDGMRSRIVSTFNQLVGASESVSVEAKSVKTLKGVKAVSRPA